MAPQHSYDPADGFPHIMPSLRYDDVRKVLSWLRDAFGLSEYLQWSSDDGVIQHAEMRAGSGFVELAAATGEWPGPRALGGTSSALIVMVDDVDGHYERTRAAGAKIIAPLSDTSRGLRQYTAEDLEGHHWEFSQQTRRVPPHEWGAELSEQS